MDATTPTKVCTKCGETKPLDDFSAKPTGKLGRASACKVCAAAKTRAYHAANAEKVRERDAARYVRDREKRTAATAAWVAANREKDSARKAAWYAANRDRQMAKSKANWEQNQEHYAALRTAAYYADPEPAKQRAKEWNKANPERASEQRRAWKQANRHKLAESNRRRRARKKGAAVGLLDAPQWAAILNYYGHACAYCGATGVKLTQDHVVPLVRGGEHTSGNVVPACGDCNRRKFYKPLWAFLLDQRNVP